MSETYEPVQLIVDNLVLQGTEASLISTNAVSKAYVDAHISSAVSALVDSAPGTLDTLKEIASALNNDANLATTLANSISSEASARSLKDVDLQNQINTLSTASSGSGGSSLQSQITAEVTARTSAVSAEATRALAAESKEASDRATADALVQSNLTAEATSRLNADNALGGRVDTEVTERKSADTALSDSVTGLHNSKFDKAGGSVSGDVTLDSYLVFGVNWRVKGSADGSRLVFQHKKLDGVWRNAIPFIASV